MARGRMISASLWDSKRFASVAEKDPLAALFYVTIVTKTDREGCVEADPETLVLLLGRCGRRMGIDEAAVSSFVDTLAEAGLIERSVGPSGPFVRVVNFHEHNQIRRDREKPSRHVGGPREDSGGLREDSGGLREDSGGLREDSGGLRESAGSTPQQVKAQVEVQEEVITTTPARPRVANPGPNRGSGRGEKTSPKNDRHAPNEANRLMSCWKQAWKELHVLWNEKGFPIIIPPAMSIYEAEQVASYGNAAYFSDEQLVAEIRRVTGCLSEKGWTLTFRSIGKMIGMRIEDTARPDPVTWEPRPDKETEKSKPAAPVAGLIAGIGKETPE